jgi:hypothetical protein
MRPSALVVGVWLVVAVGGAHAQQQVTPPLAEVARQAEAAKPTVKKAKKTYTNADLSTDRRGEPSAPPPASGFVSKSLGTAVPAEEMLARSEAKAEGEEVAKESEESWRSQAMSLRKQVETLQSSLAALSVPNELNDSNPAIRKSRDADILNTREALDRLKKRWSRLEASATERKIPQAWLEPRPQFAP